MIAGVYFIRAGSDGLIKIGWAANVFTRAMMLQTGCPEPLYIVATIPDALPSVERRLHRRFHSLRVRGEWFRPDKELLAFISTNAVAWTGDQSLPGRQHIVRERQPGYGVNPVYLVDRRESLGLTQQEVADRAGMAQQTYARIESGERTNPRISTVMQIAVVLGTTLESLRRPPADRPPAPKPSRPSRRRGGRP